jgi:hypothetical protein
MEKPDVLLEYERCEQYNIPLVAGGLQDQPHMWLLEQDIVREVIILFKSMPSLADGGQ